MFSALIFPSLGQKSFNQRELQASSLALKERVCVVGGRRTKIRSLFNDDVIVECLVEALAKCEFRTGRYCGFQPGHPGGFCIC